MLEQYREYRNAEGVKPATIDHELETLRSAFIRARDEHTPPLVVVLPQMKDVWRTLLYQKPCPKECLILDNAIGKLEGDLAWLALPLDQSAPRTKQIHESRGQTIDAP